MKKRLMIATIGLAVFLSIGVAATASSLLEEIQVYLNKEVKLKLNGAPWQATRDGQVQYPLTYNGTTYLPVRAIAEALEIPIDYEADTNTVLIGGSTEQVPILGEAYNDLSATITDDANERVLQGVDYGKVIWFPRIIHSTSRFQLEPAGQYSTLVLKLGIEGDATQIKIINMRDSSVIKSVLVTEDEGIIEIESGITGMEKIQIEVMADQPNTSSTVKIISGESYYTAK